MTPIQLQQSHMIYRTHSAKALDTLMLSLFRCALFCFKRDLKFNPPQNEKPRSIYSYDEYGNPVETGTDIFLMKMTGGYHGRLEQKPCFGTSGTFLGLRNVGLIQ